MLHYPEVMKKAQDELDKVVGPDRLPGFEDRDRLPYLHALMNETLRWRPIAVLGGTPHAVIADDEYNGMYVCPLFASARLIRSCNISQVYSQGLYSLR